MEKRRVGSLDIFPVDLIGKILSHVGSAQYVAMASTTCRKWRNAATHHLHRLTFNTRDFYAHIRSQEDCEMIITEAIMKKTSLCELSIGDMDNVEIHGASVIAWLLHTKKTLKSLTLLAQVTTQVDILTKLAGIDGALERLVWRPTYIPSLDPAMHNLPFLVSLTLDSVLQDMDWKNLQALLSTFPKLESLCLSIMSIKNAPPQIELCISLSLRTLAMGLIGFKLSTFATTTLVLYAYNLEKLFLSHVYSDGFVAFDTRQISGLRDLRINSANITWLALGDDLQHLVLVDAQFLQVDVANLPSLQCLKLCTSGDLMPVWPTYAYIIINASSKLSSLQLLGGLPAYAALDVEIILSLFPYLRWLALDYQHAIFGDPPQKPQVWEQLVGLELRTAVVDTDPELFAHWTVKFLERCPNLQRLGIMTYGGDHEKFEFLSRLYPLLLHLLSPYQHVDLQMD